MKAWLKGGLIGLLIFLMLIPVLKLHMLFCTISFGCDYIRTTYVLLIIGVIFILVGALIGCIYNKIKSRK